MSVRFELNDPTAFTDYFLENADDPSLKKGVELATSWAYNTVGITRQYDGAVQQDLRQGLLMAQGFDMHASDEEIETSEINNYNWEHVMRAADILSKFWSRSAEFVLWTVEAPYLNGYGRWIDPKKGCNIEEQEAKSTIRERLAA